MNYLPLLTEDEVRYICSVIPMQDAIGYFRHNPKEFAKICPGFRSTASSISKLNISNLLFNHRNSSFFSLFIDSHIDDWLKQIYEHYEKCLKDGDSKETALLLHTLPFCFFSGNIRLYFKLTKEEHSDEFISLLNEVANEIKEIYENKEAQYEKLKSKDSDIEKLNLRLETSDCALESAKSKLSQMAYDIKELKLKNCDIEKLSAVLKKKEQEIAYLNQNIREQKETIQILTVELSEAANSKQLLEVQVTEELEKRQATKAQEHSSVAKPKCPSDMDEFKDYLGFNLESLGVSSIDEYYPLLKEHLCRVLFKGVPIVVNRSVGVTLMKCVKNALIGQSDVKMLTFKQGMCIEEVDSFLLTAGRIVCLDNFIGNYNETELLQLFDKHRGQIIFLTVAYDRTLNYVSKEFLRYCQYLNLNRIAALTDGAGLTEDPSTVDEVEYTLQGLLPDNRYSPLLREMLNEFGYLNGLVEQKCSIISDEQDLCRALAFDILPYCVDVLKIAPYNCSERFQKYAGDKGRCKNKGLFRRWFAL